uniref:Histone acetyltransferase n=1 Tax=Panagrolaimus sp. PS1159 TaxID=55785 RepID=A0AC35EYV2_9BILA
IPDPTMKREPNSNDSPSSPSSPSSSSSSKDSDDDKSDDEFVDFRQKFSEMDLKPLINMQGMTWRDLLPPKPPKDGEDEPSSESSVTTDSDDDPKPLQWEAAGATRPPEWERYRSTNERVIYRRYIRRALIYRRYIRRACRTIIKSNKRKSKIHKFLQIGDFAPDRPIPDPPTRIPDAIVDDDECAEIPNYMSMHDMINEATPEHKSLLIKHFNDMHRMDVRRIREYEKAAADGPVPKFIYISKYQMKTSYTSPLPFHLRVKDELFLCDQCLDGWIDRDPYERHTKVCQMKTPPGKMIYKDEENRFAFFEVDALTYPSYCQMLCCLGISYIEHKSLHTDIEPFLFYVLAKKEKERDFYHFIGYFSKQKYGHSSCNLCCLLVLPCYQGKGYGRYIVDFSFLLSRVEKIPGTPERPLSEAADFLYYRYYYESFLEMVFSWWQCNE